MGSMNKKKQAAPRLPQKIKVKPVGKNDIALRLDKTTITDVRYLLGNLALDVMENACRDKEMFENVQSFWHKILNEDFRVNQ